MVNPSGYGPIQPSQQINQLNDDSLVQHSLGNASPEKDLGPARSIDDVSLNQAGAHERITLGKIASTLARVSAGAAGGIFYGAAILVGGGTVLASLVVLSVIVVPSSILGGGIGALVGAFSGGVKDGAVKGFVAGAALPLGIGLGLSILPRAAVAFTVGNMGAGLLAFAIEGKGEDNYEKEDLLFKSLLKITFKVDYKSFEKSMNAITSLL